MDGGTSGARGRARPAAFSEESLEAAAKRAAGEGRWLLIDVVDRSKPVSWATLYTTWRDPFVVGWLEDNAVAIQVDVRADAADAGALGVEPEVAPVVLLHRDGKERLRIRGHYSAAELVGKLERAEIAEGNLRLARKMLKNPDRDAFDRSGLARALLRAGLLEEALGHYDWLWCHAVEVDPEMAGPLASFIASEISELCAKLPAAHARFAELRDGAGAQAATESQAGLEACAKFLILNEALDEEERTLAWLRGLDARERRALPFGVTRFRLLPLLYEREQWADAGSVIRDPLNELKAIIERADLLGPLRSRDLRAYRHDAILEGEPEQARTLGRFSRGLYGDVAVLCRSLRAAGRDVDAAAVKEAALRHEDSVAMRAAVP
jgi:hypothetical protein